MAGVSIDPDADDDTEQPPRALCAEIEHHVRALLRDVVCGYLEPSLRSVADDILLTGAEPIEIHARDLREDDEPGQDDGPWEEAPEPEPEWEPEPEPDHPAVNATTRLPDGPGTAADPRSAAWAITALPGPRTYREAPPPRVEERVEMGDDLAAEADATIADQPLPRGEVDVAEPISVEPPVGDAPGSELSVDDLDAAPAADAHANGGPVQEELDAGVTPSADWELDDDPASYSAPI
jgi:hypothetical protein